MNAATEAATDKVSKQFPRSGIFRPVCVRVCVTVRVRASVRVARVCAACRVRVTGACVSVTECMYGSVRQSGSGSLPAELWSRESH